jgi:hypothetical protein
MPLFLRASNDKRYIYIHAIQLMENVYSKVTALLFIETSIAINNGVGQGYSLSPLLFNLALIW